MELRDYITIFKKQKKIFWAIVFLSVLAATVWQKNQEAQYQATLLLNIGRTGGEVTQEYTYDSFYRLQADERFADTVVRWLGSPRVVEDIYGAANIDLEKRGMRDLKGMFGAKRLSSQMIEVTYTDVSDKTLKKISEAAIVTLNRYTDSLNKENDETNWFTVIGSDPIVRDAHIPLPLALVIGLLFGIFVGFWTVLIRHYFQLTKNNKQ
ncbi:MAG: hypothetical protein Q7S04_00710 [Candidatus Moranbacteria bacterium]|nr:hypothetical protein [Candidatus Moranbacteria bacterium]